MAPPNAESLDRDPILLAVAVEQEARAVASGAPEAGGVASDRVPWRAAPLGGGLHLLVTGVGKANAAGGVVHAVAARRWAAVINLGVAGALPGSGLTPGDVVVATRSVFADEGVATESGWRSVSDLGFAATPDDRPVEPAPWLLDRLSGLADRADAIATVSTGAGTDALAQEVARRTGAVAEAMEGAAIGAALLRFAVASDTAAIPFIELRVISNATGDRSRQGWDLPKALARLESLSASVRSILGRL